MRLIKVAVAATVVVTAVAVPAPALSSTISVGQLVGRRIDAAVKQDLVSGHVAGVAVAVLRHGRLIFAKGYGGSNLELATPVKSTTVFRIGSLTKQFTAAGVLLLAERGKLKIDDKLSLYLPDFPRANEVTLRDLLNHTSGIHNFTEGPVIDKISMSGATVQELVADIAGQSPLYDFDPGKGLVVQQLQLRASGRGYRKGVRQELGDVHEERDLRQARHD